MTELEKQLRLNAMLEAMELYRRSGIPDLSRDQIEGFFKVIQDELKGLDPLSEPDLVVRALKTKNLLMAFATQSKHGNLIERDYHEDLRQKLQAALVDKSFEQSDNDVAKELQKINIAYAYRQERRNSYIFAGEEQRGMGYSSLSEGVLDMIGETVREDTFNQEIDAEDLAKEL